MTRKSLIVASSAVALATTLWAGSASAEDLPHGDDVVYWSAIFHDWENQNLCMNNPWQSGNDGNQLVANGNCDGRDPGSRIYGQQQGDHIKLWFHTNDFGQPERCIDNHFGEQRDGNPIGIWHCNDGDAQKWDWDGASFHYHANPAYCIDVNAGGTLTLWHCHGGGNQKFVFNDIVAHSYGLNGEGPGKGPSGGCPNIEGEFHERDCL